MKSIIRRVERCPFCGAVDSFKVRRTMHSALKKNGRPLLAPGELRRQYAYCKSCGKPIVVSYQA